MNEIPMTKIYTVTINSLDCNGYVDNSATWSFLNSNDRDEFLDYLDTLALEEYNFEVVEDEYFANSLENAKREVNRFIYGFEVDDTDKQMCERWPNGD
jgi:hypothetical protein